MPPSNPEPITAAYKELARLQIALYIGSRPRWRRDMRRSVRVVLAGILPGIAALPVNVWLALPGAIVALTGCVMLIRAMVCRYMAKRKIQVLTKAMNVAIPPLSGQV